MQQFKAFKAWARKHPWHAAVGGVILVGLAGFVFTLTTHRSIAETIRHITKKAPTTVPSPLTGEPIPTADAGARPIAVIIENTPDARPQDGLAQASVVYEAYAEGGITRYLAEFLASDPAHPLGPVRSVRTYFLDWATEINAILGHVGGNADALDLIAGSKVYDLDEFSNGGNYWRDQSRYAPHNAYTTLQKLRDAAKVHQYPEGGATYAVWKFKDHKPVAQRPASSELTVNYGSPYQVHWSYEPASGRYLRTIEGAPDVDKSGGAQVKAANVIVQVVTQEGVVTRAGEDDLRLGTTGSGAAHLYQDGAVIDGTWRKDPGGRTRFFDSAGTEVKLNRGPTWIEVIPAWVAFG